MTPAIVTMTPTRISFSWRGSATFRIRAATCQAGRTGTRQDPDAIRSSSVSERRKNDFTSVRERPVRPVTRKTGSAQARSMALGFATIGEMSSPAAHDGRNSAISRCGSRSSREAQRTKRERRSPLESADTGSDCPPLFGTRHFVRVSAGRLCLIAGQPARRDLGRHASTDEKSATSERSSS